MHISPEPLPTRAFYFLRHGETQYNAEKRFQGHIDVPLNENGTVQARQAARVLYRQRFSRIITSPARRVLDTVNPVAEACGAEVHVEPDLMEFFVGSLEGKCVASTLAEYGLGLHDSWMQILPDDADRWEEFVPRICAAVAHWTERFANETLLIASHGLVFRALAETLAGVPAMSRNAEPYLFRPSGPDWEIVSLA